MGRHEDDARTPLGLLWRLEKCHVSNTFSILIGIDSQQKYQKSHSLGSEFLEISKTNSSFKTCQGYGDIPYDDVTFTIKMSRKGLSYLMFLVCPCLIVVSTTLFSFSLPPESGERIVVLVTNLLCFALFLFMTSEVCEVYFESRICMREHNPNHQSKLELTLLRMGYFDPFWYIFWLDERAAITLNRHRFYRLFQPSE